MVQQSAVSEVIRFAPSLYAPVAIGFFGLGTGYFIWGGQAVFGFPKDSPEVNKSMGMWGFWMPGFLQVITGLYLMVGLTWFDVFANQSPLYMAALAFTAYGTHWFVMARRRYIGASGAPEAWMAIAFLLISILGLIVFSAAGAYPLSILFTGLSLIYLTEIPTRFGVFHGERLVGCWQLLTGIWLMYLTFGVTLNLTLGRHWWV